MSERLYNLLPAVYRIRDIAEGEPLRALMSVMEDEFGVLQRDVEGLYDNWFVETCDEWMVPYLGELVQAGGVYGERGPLPTHRAWVADALRLRRRKGIPAVLARAVQAATGWRARGVEFFERLAATQHAGYPRPGRGGYVDVRAAASGERIDGPWDAYAHVVDVRSVDPEGRPASAPGGRYNLGQMGIFVWRLQSYPLPGATPRQVRPGGYTFHPLGVEGPLFNPPETQPDVTRELEERNVPDVLGRVELEADAEALRKDPHYSSEYFGADPVLRVRIAGREIPARDLHFRDLADWERPPSLPGGFRVYVDPERGRLTLPPKAEREPVEVWYSYGFSGDVGGGAYDRRAVLTPSAPGVPEWTVGAAYPGADPERHFETLAGALAAWARVGGSGIVRLLDSRTYTLAPGEGSVSLPPGAQLVLEAADGAFPTLLGDLELAAAGSGAAVLLGGVRMEGTVRLGGELELRVVHCTLRPGAPGRAAVEAREASPGMRVSVTRSITGPLSLPAHTAGLTVEDGIVDGGSGYAIAHGISPEDADPGAPATLARSTVLGVVFVASIPHASETLFCGPVIAVRDQEGRMEYCYVPPMSLTPPRHRCQPDLALAAAGEDGRDAVLAHLRPRFTSTRYGDPGYAQLAPECPRELRTGARDGSEMGVFQHLRQPLREANLRLALDEYLPYGTRAGVFYVT